MNRNFVISFFIIFHILFSFFFFFNSIVCINVFIIYILFFTLEKTGVALSLETCEKFLPVDLNLWKLELLFLNEKRKKKNYTENDYHWELNFCQKLL